MSKPRRVRLSRRKGWRKPDNTVVVARPTQWGNPYRANAYRTRGSVVAEFRDALETALDAPGSRPVRPEVRNIAARIEQLRGRNLACWCPLDEPCHADVLLELANR